MKEAFAQHQLSGRPTLEISQITLPGYGKIIINYIKQELHFPTKPTFPNGAESVSLFHDDGMHILLQCETGFSAFHFYISILMRILKKQNRIIIGNYLV